MYKIVTLSSRKAFMRCQEQLKKDKRLHESIKQLGKLHTLVVPEEHFSAFSKLMENEKYTVSENITIRLHVLNDEEEVFASAPVTVEKSQAVRRPESLKRKTIRVAVIDTGISRSHPDLQDQVKGRIVLAKSDPHLPQHSGHGTHIAGTIAGLPGQQDKANTPAVELYDVRAFFPNGTGELKDILEGINWAIENGMHIINMSFGTKEDSPALSHAVKAAAKAKIVMVASVGNNGGPIEYPAAYKEVIAVGAVDEKERLAEFSSRGPKMDVVAPGVGIRSTWLEKKYRVLSGTSMAAAHISGLYALMLGSNERAVKQTYRAKQLAAKALLESQDQENRPEGVKAQ